MDYQSVEHTDLLDDLRLMQSDIKESSYSSCDCQDLEKNDSSSVIAVLPRTCSCANRRFASLGLLVADVPRDVRKSSQLLNR